MQQKGVPLPLYEDEFPWRNAIVRESIVEEIHFVVPKHCMLGHTFTMGDYCHDRESWATISALTFIAEACWNVKTYRGDMRPYDLLKSQNDEYYSRITPILSYIPKRTHTEDGELLSPEDLLMDNNIAAYMFSVFVRDEQLKLSYAFADQLDINRYGKPVPRMKGDGDDIVKMMAEPAPPQRALPAPGDDFAGPDAFNNNDDDDDDDNDESSEAADADAAPNNAGNRNNIDADKYRPLDAYGSRYWYPKKVDPTKDTRKFKKKKKLEPGQQPLLHKPIKSVQDYIDIVVTAFGRIDVQQHGAIFRYTASSPHFSLADIQEDEPVHHKNFLSLNTALAKLRQLGAAPAFGELRNWRDADGNFVVPMMQGLHLAAHLRMPYFNADALFKYQLPHRRVLDRTLIQPKGLSNKGRFLTLDSGREVDMDAMFASKKIVLEHDRLKNLRDSNCKYDIWQTYFDTFRSVEIEMKKEFRRANYRALPPELLKRLRQFRSQGVQHYASVNHLQNPDLPDGNIALLEWRINQGDIAVPVMHLFEPLGPNGEMPISPFSQWRANEILCAESIMKVADFMVLLFPKLLLSAVMVWLPFMNGATNKEHMQFIGPPGSMKSDTLKRLQNVLIAETFLPKSGGSKKGILGPHRSQRLIEIYHELNGILAPSANPSGSDQEVTECKLTQLSEGLYIWDTSMEDPKTNQRIDVRKVSHYTNSVFGAKNPPGRRRITSDGAAAAMLDRCSVHKIIPTAQPGHQTISERVFQDFMSATESADLPQEMFQIMQLAGAEYCCLMSCYAVPLPNIDLFSSVAPNAIGYLATMHPELANRLRDMGRIKTRLYAECLTDMARYALFSAIGLAGQKLRGDGPYIYNTEEVVNEMSKYAYTDYEKMIFVLSGSVYNMSEGQYNSIAATFLRSTTDYVELGAGPEADPANAATLGWPKQVDLDKPVDPAKATRMAAKSSDVTTWSLEQVLDEVLSQGKNHLSTPKLDATGSGDQPYIMRPHTRAANAYSDPDNAWMQHKFTEQPENLDLDLFSIVAGITNERPEPPRLERAYSADLFKLETIAGNTYVNFNYIRLSGTADQFANSFSDPVGGRVMTAETIKDILYTLKRTKIIAPYLPVMPKLNTLVVNHPGYVQALRHSYTAQRRFQLYNLPVLIQDSKCFYILAAYAETNPAVVIDQMVQHMCYEATRETRTVIGVPITDGSIDFRTVHIKPRPGVALTVARKSNLTDANFARLQKQFGLAEGDIDGYAQDNANTVYTDVDIEEQMALRAIFYAHPELTLEQAKKYTPRGIYKRFYGEQGVYQAGNPYTVARPVQAPSSAKRKADNGPAKQSSKRVNRSSESKPAFHRMVPGLDMQPPPTQTLGDPWGD